MRKTKVKMNKPVYLGLSILHISKTLMYEFQYDYMKPKYGDNAKLCYMDTESFIINIKTDFYEDIADDVEEWFDTPNYKIDRLLLITDKNKKALGKFRDELGGRIITELGTLRPKTYAYLMNDDSEVKKNKRNKEMCNKKSA